MSDSSLVTPFHQTPHYSSVRSRKHKVLHGLFVDPNRACPKRVPCIAQKRNRNRTLRKLGLSSRAIRLHEKNRDIAPGSYAKPGHRNKESSHSPLGNIATTPSVKTSTYSVGTLSTKHIFQNAAISLRDSSR